MPRKGSPGRREIQPDPVYQNVLVTQLISDVGYAFLNPRIRVH